jgi:hypothetical protein
MKPERVLREDRGGLMCSIVIPGWTEGPDLRCAIAHREISRFPDVQLHIMARRFAPPRDDDVKQKSPVFRPGF